MSDWVSRRCIWERNETFRSPIGLRACPGSAPKHRKDVLSALVYIASNPTQFVSQLKAAKEENNLLHAFGRRVVAERESWSARCTAIVWKSRAAGCEGAARGYRAELNTPF